MIRTLVVLFGLSLAGLAVAADRFPLVQDDGGHFTAGPAQPAETLESEFKNPSAGLAAVLTALTPGEPRTLGAVTIVPLLQQNALPPPLALGAAGPPTAAHAKDTGAQFQDIGQPSPGIELALLGQVLEGPKTQDRLMERSELIPPGGQSRVTAFCCEHLFVAQIGEPLDMTAHFVPGSIRMKLVEAYQHDAALMAKLTELNRDLGPTQEFTWAEIAERIKAKNVASKYEAFLDQIPYRSAEVKALIAQPLPPETSGFAIGQGDKLIAIEVFGSPAHLAPHAAELMASWLDVSPDAANLTAAPQAVREAAVELLKKYPACDAFVGNAGGAVTLVLGGASTTGLALSVRGRPLHALLVPR